MDESRATLPWNFTDLLKPVGYADTEYGYTMREDGTGYLAVYTTYPGCTPEMLGWYFRWINIRSRSTPEGVGNIRYKIWNQADHWDHGFINGVDKTDGIYTVESLDLGEGEEMLWSVRHPLDPKDFGLTTEMEKQLKEAGCFVDCCTESFHPVEDPSVTLPGTHLFMTLSRINPWGVLEKVTREWIGYGVEDGKIVKDESTPDWMLNEGYLKKVITHSTTEALQLSKFLPQLHAEYKDKPDDAD
ncbi:hypothetical protein E8D37_08700 [Nocardioides sp. GY 10127]|nr:hypothetical protein E8D37_08700 [Nocardioides sp. GY 10127]